MSSKWLQEKTWKCINMTAVLHSSFYTSCRDHAWQRELFPLKKSTVVGFSFLSGLPFNCFCFDFSSQKMMKKTEISENYYLNCIQNLSIPCKYMGHLYTCGVFKLNPLQIKKKEKKNRLKLQNIPVRQVNLFIKDYFTFYWDTGTSRVKHCGFLTACSHTTQEVRGQEMKTILSNLILRRKEIGGM